MRFLLVDDIPFNNISLSKVLEMALKEDFDLEIECCNNG